MELSYFFFSPHRKQLILAYRSFFFWDHNSSFISAPRSPLYSWDPPVCTVFFFSKGPSHLCLIASIVLGCPSYVALLPLSSSRIHEFFSTLSEIRQDASVGPCLPTLITAPNPPWFAKVGPFLVSRPLSRIVCGSAVFFTLFCANFKCVLPSLSRLPPAFTPALTVLDYFDDINPPQAPRSVFS